MSYTNGAKILKAKINANQAVVDMVNDAGGIRKTEPEQSDRLGSNWVHTIVGDTIVKTEYIPLPYPYPGSDADPFPWYPALLLMPNAYYTYDGVRKVWTGENGVTASWDDARFVTF